MVKRSCPKCNVIFDRKSSYDKHINKKFDCSKNYIENNNIENNLPNLAQICQNQNNYANTINNDIINSDSVNLFCSYCKKYYSSKYTLARHINSGCKVKKQFDNQKNDNKDKIIEELKKQNKILAEKIDKVSDLVVKNNQINQIHKTIKKLESTIPANTNLSISSQLVEQIIQKDKQLEEFIVVKNNSNNFKSNIPNDDFNDLIEKNANIEIEQTDNKKPMTLILNQNVIEYRKSDGYINATQLCKAGGKKFSHWINLESTKELICVFASDAGIPASLLIDIKKGNSINFEQGTWIHSDLAIQLAQWISPKFALQVSHWIRKLFTEGKVEVNLKILKEQENIIKDRDKRIKVLENMILKRQTRNKYDESVNVVYIITNEYTKSKRTYTIGKAKNLVERLSTYDKLQTHEVIYSKSFKDEIQMKIAEDIVLNKLNKYKEIECRDRFILPIGADIKLFIKPIADAFNLLSD